MPQISHDYLYGDWESAKGNLRDELEQLVLYVQLLRQTTFSINGSLLAAAVSGDSTIPTRSIVNTGVGSTPKWDQVSLSTGVKSTLSLAKLVPAVASTVVGRESGSAGNYEALTVSEGLEISGTVIGATAGTKAGARLELHTACQGL